MKVCVLNSFAKHYVDNFEVRFYLLNMTCFIYIISVYILDNNVLFVEVQLTLPQNYVQFSSLILYLISQVVTINRSCGFDLGYEGHN